MLLCGLQRDLLRAYLFIIATLQLEALGILVDYDDNGYLLQIFTKVRPIPNESSTFGISSKYPVFEFTAFLLATTHMFSLVFITSLSALGGSPNPLHRDHRAP